MHVGHPFAPSDGRPNVHVSVTTYLLEMPVPWLDTPRGY